MEIISKIKKIKRYIFDDIYSFIIYNLKYKNYIPVTVAVKNYKEGITAVITSCGRHEKLDKMLNTLVKMADVEFESVILVEDAGCIDSVNVAKKYISESKLKIIFHEKNIGQLRSIDEAYSYVTTKYIFHIEDDWEFIETGFLQYSLEIFKRNPRLACLSLRPHKDWSKYSLLKKNDYYLVDKIHNFVWQGLCINPGLYDKNKYDQLGDYKRYYKERIISQVYGELGFQGGISNNKKGYVIHTGDGYTTRKKYTVA
jgi:hypothetical protein